MIVRIWRKKFIATTYQFDWQKNNRWLLFGGQKIQKLKTLLNLV
jgi:hypothetical protein